MQTMDLSKMVFRHSKSSDGVNTLTVDQIPNLVVTGSSPIDCVRNMRKRLRDMAQALNLEFVDEPIMRREPPVRNTKTRGRTKSRKNNN